MTASPLDHLVIVAATLDEGVAWCEATLGITPGPGGEHALMGTHNRLFRIATPAFPCAYFEIIAINSIAEKGRPSWLKRWFDMDNPTLQAHVRQHGPQLACAVAQVQDITATQARLAALGVDTGPIIAFSRPSASGPLTWQMTVRDDGQRLMHGALPAPIQWSSHHPGTALADRGVTLQALHLFHPETPRLARALEAAGLTPLTPEPLRTGPPGLSATLSTPKGLVTLSTPVLDLMP